MKAVLFFCCVVLGVGGALGAGKERVVLKMDVAFVMPDGERQMKPGGCGVSGGEADERK